MTLSMSGNDSISIWMDQVSQGERQPVRKLLERFLPRLVALASARLRGQPELVGYAEDIALSVFNSLCIGAERGRFPNLSNRKAIWQLLAVMTVRKTIDLKRKARREEQVASEELHDFLSAEPSPDRKAEMGDRVSELLARLDDPELQQIVHWKVEGFGNEEISLMLGCTVRTVERRLQRIRSLWQQELAEN